jgi:hypothetical protein
MSRSLTDSSTDNKLTLATHRVSRLERRPPVGAEEVIETTKVTINTAATSTTLVTAQVGRKIRVIFFFFTLATDADVKLTSGVGGTPETGQAHLPLRGGAVLNYNPSGWFDTDINEALVLNKASAAGNVGGILGYTLV